MLALFCKNSLSNLYIDIYDCSTRDFFVKDAEITPGSPELICRLETSHIDLNSARLVFSARGQNVAIMTNKAIQLFDLSLAKGSCIQSDSTETCDNFERVREFTLINSVYDSILNIYLSTEDIDQTWLVLSSKIFGLVRFIKLGNLLILGVPVGRLEPAGNYSV